MYILIILRSKFNEIYCTEFQRKSKRTKLVGGTFLSNEYPVYSCGFGCIVLKTARDFGIEENSYTFVYALTVCLN